jgi:polyisoprenyl-teichoic acid--peptidoglycan teichoic acid transferase
MPSSTAKGRSTGFYLSLALTLFLVGALVYVAFLALGPDAEPGPTAQPDLIPPPENTDPLVAQPSAIRGPQVNVLLLGLDQRGLSDAIVLVTYNLDTSTGAIVSLKRDTYVPFQTWSEKGQGHDALGWASYVGMDYGNGLYLDGASYMAETIEELLGIRIDYYAAIDFTGLVNLIDLLGGVEIDVPPAFTAKYGALLPTGRQRLNGEQALVFARHRQHPRIPEAGSLSEDGDRIIRNQNLLKAVIEQCRSLDTDRLLAVYEALEDDLHTNMTDWDLLELANLLYNHEDLQQIKQAVLPGELRKVHEELINREIEYYFLDQAACTALLIELGLK